MLCKDLINSGFRSAVHHFIELLWMGELFVMNMSQMVTLHFFESNLNLMLSF
jgi:hypothetical protein